MQYDRRLLLGANVTMRAANGTVIRYGVKPYHVVRRRSWQLYIPRRLWNGEDGLL